MRLIDADALVDDGLRFQDGYDYDGIMMVRLGDVLKSVRNAPTIDAISTDDVAEMLAEQFNDRCPCNYNSNDEWLPYVCELTDECPNPKDPLGCWKQFIKHYGR